MSEEDTVSDAVIIGGLDDIRRWLKANPGKPFRRRGGYFDSSHGPIVFDDIEFDCEVDFKGTEFKHIVSFRNCVFKKPFILAGGINIEKKQTVNTSIFDGAEFHDHAEFGNRRFIYTTSFRNCIFRVAPNFHNSTLHQDTDFGGAQFPDFESPGAARAYGTLKAAMNGAQAHHEELIFFGLEMRSRRAQEPWPNKAYYLLYERVSDYGQSVVLPLVILLAIITISIPIYMAIYVGPLQFDFGDKELLKAEAKAFSLAVGSSLPLIIPAGVKSSDPFSALPILGQIASGIQMVVSLAMLFLIGLALRNLFRLKN